MEYDSDLHSVKCPKCGHGMNEITYEGITIDRCSNCQGLWFDEDEAQQLKKLKGSRLLDTGDATEGWKFDSRADINCPRCGKPMEKTADSKQKHIWYEICRDHGMFMDAGEFADFVVETPLDWFCGLVKGNRETVAP